MDFGATICGGAKKKKKKPLEKPHHHRLKIKSKKFGFEKLDKLRGIEPDNSQ